MLAKKVSFGLGALLMLGMLLMGIWNRASLSGAGGEVPLWLSIPFAGLLLCIALCPLLCSSWWESHQPLAVAFWSLAFLIPYALMGGLGTAVETALECLIGDYLTFIVLLFGLFCVAGNISLEGDLAGSPRINVFLLLLGTVLSSWIGTTGASMLMVRPVIKMNAWRRHRSHIMVFFIFLISNMGGCLTPIGDPPLLMGFSRGVPFFWSLQLAPVLLFNAVILLAVFYWIDMRAYRKDIAAGNMPDIRKPGTEIHIRGLHNLIFLVMIVAAVVLSGVLPTLPMFQNEAGEVIGIPIFGEVTLTIPALLEIIIILLAAFLSFKTTDVSVRNHHAARPDAPHRQGRRAGAHPPGGDVLGHRRPVQLPGQHPHLSGLPDGGLCPGGTDRAGHHPGGRAHQDAGGHLLRRGVHGGQHLYRQRAQLYGQVHLG